MRPRVGHIQFLNCLPIYYGLVRRSGILDLDLVKGAPTELNRLLMEGRLDISPISSIEYAKHVEELVLMPDFTVSSDGPVKSILLVSKVPAPELSGKQVALANTSATSQVLTRIILEDKYGVRAEYFESPPDLARMLFEGEAALLIGDEALRYVEADLGLHVYDLGAEWKELTGKAMVFAVWGVRREFAEADPGMVRHVYELFKNSMDYSVSHFSEIAMDAARWERFSFEFLEGYFRTLHFEFGLAYQEGLLEYYRRAAGLGLIEQVPKLEFVDLERTHS